MAIGQKVRLKFEHSNRHYYLPATGFVTSIEDGYVFIRRTVDSPRADVITLEKFLKLYEVVPE